MKEATADTVDSEEETMVIPSPDASPKTTKNSEEKRPMKRECSFEDEDQRPNKVRKISSSDSEKTAPSGGTSNDGNLVISTQHFSASIAQHSPHAGCSKDDEVHSDEPNTSCSSMKINDSLKEESQSSNNDTEEDVTLPVELMNLSDDVLLIIMSNLKPTDLLNLSL